MVEIKLTEHEVILLAGLIGATAGNDLNHVYIELLDIMYKLDPSKHLANLSGLITDEIAGMLKGKKINEDQIFEEICEYLRKVNPN